MRIIILVRLIICVIIKEITYVLEDIYDLFKKDSKFYPSCHWECRCHILYNDLKRINKMIKRRDDAIRRKINKNIKRTKKDTTIELY